MTDTSHRRLAAILFADIEGYTAMMQSDEGMTMTRLKRYQETLSTQVTRHGGELIKNYGDGSLCLFSSVLDAVQCAKDIQIALLLEPRVPLRIGLHLGDIMHRDNDIYGDAVNIASRIESLGVAHSILLSKEVYQKIKNQPDLSFSELGEYDLKNISEKVGVYALSNDGLVVPSRGDLKKQAPPTSGPSWFSPKVTLAAVMLLAALGFMISKFIPTSSANSSDRSGVIGTKVAVLPFANQTQDEAFVAYGAMISDWVTKGLMESDDIQIFSGSAGSPKEPGSQVNIQLLKEDGVGHAINGRYYIAESELHVIADIIDVHDGDIIQTFRQSGSKTASMSLLSDITDQVINYWAVKDNIQLNHRPPRYTAYQSYIQGMELYTIDAKRSVSLFQESYNQDTTFLAPLFKAVNLYLNLGELDKRKELLDYLDTRKSEFSKFERLEFDIRLAGNRLDYLRMAQLYEKKLALDPADDGVNYNIAYCYSLANFPNKTLEVLARYDSLKSGDKVAPNWRMALEYFARKRTGQCQNVVNNTQHIEYAEFPVVLAVMHLQCLVELDSVEQAFQSLDYYNQIGVYNPIGGNVKHELPFILCNHLLTRGHEDYLNKCSSLITHIKSDPSASSASVDIYNNHTFRPEESRGFQSFYKGQYEKALSYWKKENIHQNNWADQIDRASRVGYLSAKLGLKSEAQAQLRLIDDMSYDNTYFPMTQQYYRSRILVGLGDTGQALGSLRQSLQSGMSNYRPSVFEDDPFLIDINPQVKELMVPKG